MRVLLEAVVVTVAHLSVSVHLLVGLFGGVSRVSVEGCCCPGAIADVHMPTLSMCIWTYLT